MPVSTPIFVIGDEAVAEILDEPPTSFFSRPIAPSSVMSTVFHHLTQGQAPHGYAAVSGSALRLLDKFSATLDDALDREMMDAARTAIGQPMDAADSDALSEFSPGGHTTREAPEALVQEILADPQPTAPPEDDVPFEPSTHSRSGAGPLPSHEVRDFDLAQILGRAFSDAYTGRLRVSHRDADKTVYFESGRPVLATSSVVHDRMIELFLRQGRLSPEQHRLAVSVATESGRRMGAVLIELGIMKSDELLPAVREHYEEIIFSLFAWDRAAFGLEPGVVADPRRIRLLRHPAALANEGVRRAFSSERLRARLGSARNVFRLETRGAMTEILAEMRLEARERQAVALFDGVRPWEDLSREATASCGISEDRLLAIATTLSSFGALEPTAASTSVGGPGRGARDEAIVVDRIRARFALAQDGDYFRVLGVPVTATAADVSRAYEHQMRELTDEVVGPQLTTRFAQEVETCREVLNEALRILTKDSVRLAYARAIKPTDSAGLVSAAEG